MCYIQDITYGLRRKYDLHVESCYACVVAFMGLLMRDKKTLSKTYKKTRQLEFVCVCQSTVYCSYQTCTCLLTLEDTWKVCEMSLIWVSETHFCPMTAILRGVFQTFLAITLFQSAVQCENVVKLFIRAKVSFLGHRSLKLLTAVQRREGGISNLLIISDYNNIWNK